MPPYARRRVVETEVIHLSRGAQLSLQRAMEKTSIIAAVVGALSVAFVEFLKAWAKAWGEKVGEAGVPTIVRSLPRVFSSVPLKWSATAYFVLWWVGLALAIMTAGAYVRLLTAIGLLIAALCLTLAADRIRHDTLIGMGWIGVGFAIGAIYMTPSYPGVATALYYLVGAILFTVSLSLRRTWQQKV